MKKERYKSLNPLTGLPGNADITKHLERAASSEEMLAVYIDIADFKPYNEVYGFTAGDNVIIRLSRLLSSICESLCGKDCFLGHIGGDDFAAVIDKGYLDDFFGGLDTEFLNMRDGFYHQQDISRGFIVGWDRSGERTRFPLMGICGVAFSPFRRKLYSAGQISVYATYLKEASKSVRDKDNILITPDALHILPVPLRDYILDDRIPLYRKRTVIEAMGESGLIHYGSMLSDLLDERIHLLLKKSIIFALGRLRYLPAEEKILGYTDHHSPHIRTRAVEAIGHIGGARHIELVAEKLNDPNPYVAVMAAKTIGDIGHPDGLCFLRNISSGSSRWLKVEAVMTRCSMGDRLALYELRELVNDINPLFRKRASRMFQLIPSKEGVETLCAALKKEKLKEVRKAFILSIARTSEQLSSRDIRDISSLIRSAYRAADPEEKVYLLPLVGSCRFRNPVKILARAVSSSSRLERMKGLEGLAGCCDDSNIYLLRRGMKDVSGQIRARTAELLGNIEDIGSMETLRKALKDPDGMVRKRASEAVLKMAETSYYGKK